MGFLYPILKIGYQSNQKTIFQIEIFTMTTTTYPLLPKPNNRQKVEVTDDFIKNYQDNKLYEMRFKSQLMKVFYECLSPYGNSKKQIQFVIESFWTVIDNLYPKMDIKFNDIKPFIISDFDMSQNEEEEV